MRLSSSFAGTHAAPHSIQAGFFKDFDKEVQHLFVQVNDGDISVEAATSAFLRDSEGWMIRLSGGFND